ncbi:MAG: hypothetical protein PHX80_04365 [Candidatus Nanoarchaeia archaeon]|nr:hypothetical protein [Candidatus Nanoarchaeia archaeon]MDD5551250.1 hypothetical protein [Candidatus Omnitrophota bacterium]
MIHKSTEQLIDEGIRFKKYRELMGINRRQLAKLLNMKSASDLSDMEKGRKNTRWRLEATYKLFIIWRTKEIKRLEEQIQYLKSIK